MCLIFWRTSRIINHYGLYSSYEYIQFTSKPMGCSIYQLRIAFKHRIEFIHSLGRSAATYTGIGAKYESWSQWIFTFLYEYFFKAINMTMAHTSYTTKATNQTGLLKKSQTGVRLDYRNRNSMETKGCLSIQFLNHTLSAQEW